MDSLKMQSPNLVDANIEKIAALFPNCITEDRDENGTVRRVVDFDQLRQELSSSLVEGPRERYTLNWPGKNEAILTANAPIAKTLRPCKEESVDFDNTQNIYIEGDNLDALKLLQETYLNKIKMIYIDPPYNTGSDLIYEDDFAEDMEIFLKRSNQKDEQGNRLVANTEANGRFHSDWLSMIYPRLKLARTLLREEGVIFISIDDNEVQNLRKACDEVFGDSNFISQIVWKKKTGAGSAIQHVFDEHEYVVVYAKNKDSLPKWRIMNEEDGNFRNPDNDVRGPWESCAFTAPSKNRNPNQLFMIEVHFNNISPDINKIDEDGRSLFETFEYLGNKIVLRHPVNNDETVFTSFDDKKNIARFIRRWAYASQNIKQIFDQNRVYLNGGNIPRFKKFESEYDGKALRSIYFNEFSTQQGTDALRQLLGEAYVEYPKPVNLLCHLINGVSDKNAIVLDFFSGSATAAHAVMKQNAEDNGNRKFIMVQIPELCDEGSDAFKAGYKTIAEIGKERIRRAGKKIKEENLITAQNLDIGFRVFKIDTSNMKDVYYTPDELKQDNLELFKDHIKPDRSPEDLLFQVFIDWGLDLTLPIAKEIIDGKSVFFVDTNVLIACFDSGINEELVKKLAAYKPLRAVFRDDAFGSDSVKINVEQIFKSLSPVTEVKSI